VFEYLLDGGGVGFQVLLWVIRGWYVTMSVFIRDQGRIILYIYWVFFYLLWIRRCLYSTYFLPASPPPPLLFFFSSR
jgi:hypothetical protein